jgi:hypothetical protein
MRVRSILCRCAFHLFLYSIMFSLKGNAQLISYIFVSIYIYEMWNFFHLNRHDLIFIISPCNYIFVFLSKQLETNSWLTDLHTKITTLYFNVIHVYTHISWFYHANTILFHNIKHNNDYTDNKIFSRVSQSGVTLKTIIHAPAFAYNVLKQKLVLVIFKQSDLTSKKTLQRSCC